MSSKSAKQGDDWALNYLLKQNALWHYLIFFSLSRTGVRAAVDWLFIRVQNSRRYVFFLKGLGRVYLLKLFSYA